MSDSRQHTSATISGGLAILFWSSAFACNRSLAEQLGPITAAAASQIVGGLVGLAYYVFRKKGFGKLLELPSSYLVGCGALFILTQTGALLSTGLAQNREQAIMVSLIHYLWPGLTLVFSIPIHRQRAGIFLVPGILAAFGGVMMVIVGDGNLTLNAWLGSVSQHWFIYLISFISAISWALYSNLSKRYAGGAAAGAVPLFLLVSGGVMAVVRLGVYEPSIITSQGVMEIVFMGLFPNFLACSLWDLSVRKGNLNLVAALSYLTPFFSALASSLYLGVSPAWTLWCGCVLIVGGAVVCKLSIVEKKAAPDRGRGTVVL